MVRNRKRSHQHKKNTFARNILRTEWNDTIQANKHTKKQLDRRLLLQWEVLQRKDNKLRIKIHDKKRHRQPRIYGKSICSPGLGAGYVKRIGKRHEWKGENTKEDYYTRRGTYIALPKYYKYKLFTEDQREQLWINRENSGEKFVGNFKVKITDEESEEYYNTLRDHRYRDWETDRKSVV